MKSVVLTRRLPHPIERVFRAVADPQELAAWCPGPPGEVVERDAPRLIVWENAGHTVRFELAADGEATVLTFTHVLPEGEPDQFAEGWETYFSRLDALLAGGALGEQEAHDQRRFSLADGRLHLRRRFFVPVARLQAALAALPGPTEGAHVSEDGSHSRLEVAVPAPDAEAAAVIAADWDRHLVRVETWLGGAAMDEAAAGALWPWVHERYRAAFVPAT